MAECNPTCSICLETFKNPVTIPCNHVFCGGCLKRHEEKNARAGSFACPLCNRVVVSCVKEEDTDEPDVSEVGFSAKCDVCGPKISATTRCQECEENYCKVCSATHLKMKASRNHRLYELGVLDQQTKNVTLYRCEFCTKHPEEEIKIVCKTCKNIPLCLLCKISEHDNHTSRILAEEVVEIKNTIEKTRTMCAVRLEQLQTCTKEVEAFDSLIDKREQEEVMRINKQEQELIHLLENKILKIKQEAQEFRESIRQVYERVRIENYFCKKQIEKEFSGCATLNNEARKLIDIEKEFQIVQRGWHLREDFLKESKQTFKIKLLSMQRNAFTPAGLPKEITELRIGAIATDIIKERKMNIFLKSCVQGEPLQLLEVEGDLKFSEVKKLVIDSYDCSPKRKLVLRIDGKEWTENKYKYNYCLKDSITNGSVIEYFWKD